MPSLHAPTLLLSLCTVMLTAGAILLSSWRQNRASRSLALWSLTQFAGAVGVALLGLRGMAHDILTVDIANAVLIVSYSLNWLGARDFSHRPVHWACVLVLPALWLALCRWPAFYNEVGWRVAVFSATAASLSFAYAYELWRFGGGRRHERLLACAWQVVHALFNVARVVLALAAPPPQSDVVVASPWVTFIVFESLVNVLIMVALQLALTKERTENRLRIAAETDPLTNIPNRRSFMERTEALMAELRAAGAPGCLLLVDVDRFKAINDTYGHAAGDQALIHVAEVIRSHLRPRDTFGRIGGEEFACCLADTTLQAGAVVAEGLRARIAAAHVRTADGAIRLSASIGLAPASEADLGTVLSAADAALYEAKRAGRDRVVASPERLRRAG